MAATRLIALHVNKGKTVAQCLADRTDYSQNAAKTNDGEFISSYECDPKTADEEFLLSKRQYQHITGRQQKNNIIAYQIRQSFKPGEITPEEANQVGYETAMRWTKGKHAFIVATHIDKSHIHNHIIYNSTSLDATRKFKNFFLSGLAVQRLSDMVCLEHGLSIITPKPYRERQKRTVYPKKRTQRDELCDAIDAVLKQKPKSFDGFVQALADMGFEFKDGKQPAFKGENQKRFIRLRSLGEGYSKEEIQAVISGKNLHKSKGGSAKAPAPKQFQMLIDIQAKMAEGKTVGYEKWAKKFNRKEAARTVILLKEKGLGNYDDLTAHIENLSARFDALSDSIKVAEKRMVEVQALQQHIKNYRNTRQIYIEYRKSGYSKKFFEEHRQEITIHKAAKQAFDELQITKLPSMQHQKREIWTAETLMHALEVCDDDILALAINLSFACSLRMGEMLGLTWDCIDISEESLKENNASIFVDKELQRVNRDVMEVLDNKDIIRVFPRTLSNTNTSLVLKTPKTKTSVRKIFLPSTVAQMLLERKKQIDEMKELFGDEYLDYDLVFCHSSGRPMEGQVINRALKKLIQDNDLPDVVFHSFRHASITYKLKWNGGDMKSVQGDSGHARMDMVADVYSHIIDEDRRYNAQKFEEQFYNAKGLKNAEEGKTAPMPKFETSVELLDPMAEVQKESEVEKEKPAENSTDENAALLTKLLSNPETAALLKALAKTI